MFGTPAKLKSRALSYYQYLCDGVDTGPFLFGVEKTGDFPEFAAVLAQHADLEPQTLITVDEEIISRVKHGSDVSDYGQETYWGRRFFYYTRDRSIISITVAPPRGQAYGAGVGQATPAAYPQLATVLATIDSTGSAMYRNAIVPVILAHAAAAYPIGVGTDVLTLVARSKLGLDGAG